jgi:hypothetical protein
MVGGIKPCRETRTRSSTARRRPVAVLTTVGDPTVSPPAQGYLHAARNRRRQGGRAGRCTDAMRAGPGVKQQLAAARMLFDWLVTGQVVPMNPASGSARAEACGEDRQDAGAQGRCLLLVCREKPYAWRAGDGRFAGCQVPERKRRCVGAASPVAKD